MTREKPCLVCHGSYVGGFRSYRCRRCQKDARPAVVARARQKRRIADGLAPSPALQRIIDLAELGPKRPPATPRVQRAPIDRRSVSVAAALVSRLDKAAIAARCNRYAIVGRILDGWSPVPAQARSS